MKTNNIKHKTLLLLLLLAAGAVIGLINLTYNMFRYGQIVRLNLLKE